MTAARPATISTMTTIAVAMILRISQSLAPLHEEERRRQAPGSWRQHAKSRTRFRARSPTTVLPASRMTVLDRPSLAALRQVPVEDLFAGPEQHAGLLPDMVERAAEVFEAVRRTHDVGVDDQRHHPGG